MAQIASEASILLVEDDRTLADFLARVLRAERYSVEVAHRADALPEARLGEFDLVISDVHLEGGTGHDVLRAVHRVAPRTPVLLVTAFADVEGAMESVAEGAYDYLSKPIDPARLKAKIAEAVARRRLSVESARQEGPPPSAPGIVGSSPAMLEVYKTVAQVAPTTATVLVSGESGTGKELVARAVHDRSKRRGAPFVAVNCAALPESILESELFGHERGSFTGAAAQKRGLFEEASGGTLFLDEIGEIGPKMQAQLLRVLQEGEIRRVGGVRPVPVDVRVVAATNRDLKTEVAAGRFREDLLFRLQVVTIAVPPLRERRQDIAPLVRHLVARHSERLGKAALRVAPAVFAALETYAFPGNVRELSHLVERALLLARDGVVTEHDLPIEVRAPIAASDGAAAGPAPLTEDWPTMGVLERRYIDRVLVYTGGNKTKAAEVLGIDRRTLGRILARDRRAGDADEAGDEDEPAD